MDEKRVSVAVIKRLPRYYRFLGDLLDNNINRISSKELSKKMNITASQIRQDLNNFGCFGLQGYGYNVPNLYKEIQKILGLEEEHNMILVGVGNIGRALAQYKSFEKRGFRFVGVFDKNPDLIGKELGNNKIRDINDLSKFLVDTEVNIAVIAVPRNSASKIVEILAINGVKGIWNFSNAELDIPKSMFCENVYLTDSLMTLTYRLHEDEILKKYS
ncbi:MAG: redox-sensing transcriptional repressor Rex [Lachnospirales bacterium]